MTISALMIMSLVVFVVLRFGVLPFVSREHSGTNTLADIGRKAMEAGVSTAASIMFWLTMSAALALGLVRYLRNLKSSTLGEAENSLESVRQVSDFLDSINGNFGFLVLGLCALATVVWSYRRTKMAGQKQLNLQFAEKMAELHERHLAGDLEEILPNDAMNEIETLIAAKAQELAEFEKSNDDPEAIVQAKQELQHLAELRHNVDLLRRAEFEVSAEREKTIAHPTKSKLLTFFTSDGFFGTLGFGGKVLVIIGVLSIIPASLVITGPIAESISKGKRVSLEEDLRSLTFVAQVGEINQAYDQLLAQSVGTAKLTEEDELIADALAQNFESNLVADEALSNADQKIAQAAIRTIARESVRQAVLSRTSARSGSLSLSSASPASSAQNLVQAEQMLGTAQKGKPVTPLGKQASKNYLELAQRNPKLWESLKGNFKAYHASFGRSASPIRISGIALNQAIGDALGSMGANGSIFSQQAAKFGGQISSDAAKTYFEASFKKFVVEFNSTGDLVKSAQSSGSLSNTAFSKRQVSGLRQMVAALPNSQTINDRIAASRSSLSAASPRVNQTNVKIALGRVGAQAVGDLDSLSSFNDYFPGHAGQEFNTSKASAARSLGFRGAPPALTSATRAQISRSARLASRSGSFIRLRGFSRIGGVLIGREAEDGPPINVHAFDWEIENNALWFTIAVNDNKPRRLGPYSPAIANIALPYAADGRPTTVTMVTAPPLLDLKVLTHPALIDTGLGCRARRLDQFADEASSLSEELKQVRKFETEFAIGEVQLYNLARNIQVLSGYNTTAGKAFIDGQDAIEIIMQAEADSRLPNPTLYGQAEFRLSDKKAPLTIAQKPAYFLESTLKLVSECRQAVTLPEFASCVQTNADLSSISVVRQGLGWLAPAADFQPWSGVRERTYSIDESFKYLESGFPQDLGPLRFMVQLAIASPAYFADPSKEWIEEDNLAVDEYTDPEPWEFDSTSNLTNALVLENIKKDNERRRVYEDMIEFTLLQRFFRSVLDGPLSDTFPLEQLVDIQEATSKYVNNNAPTVRWNAIRLQLERLLYEKLEETAKTANPGPKTRECVLQMMELQSAGSQAEVEALGSWDLVCSGQALSGEVTGEIEQMASEVANVLALRRALGVGVDDFLGEKYRRNGCPTP